jgi:hypothetical protein
VAVEATCADPRDVVLVLGDAALAAALDGRVGRVESGHALRAPPGLSVVVAHDWLRRRAPSAQRAFFLDASRVLPRRGLLVVGDVMWSVDPAMVDEPEQFGDGVERAPTTRSVEQWARDAGFLPDLHRFGVGRAVLVALRAN